ncbi:hypothetical protein [Neobacillus niacini]|uniref:hypothetical protein n=1 Tax=Neobacillus niacini TaxID=86668 RepID=UPI00286B91F4|nr:hypothetical protein [Neobacillus niacini]
MLKVSVDSVTVILLIYYSHMVSEQIEPLYFTLGGNHRLSMITQFTIHTWFRVKECKSTDEFNTAYIKKRQAYSVLTFPFYNANRQYFMNTLGLVASASLT